MNKKKSLMILLLLVLAPLLGLIPLGLIPIVPVSASPDVIVDSYTEGNASGSGYALKAFHPSSNELYSAAGQCFLTPGISYLITSAKFYLSRDGVPTGMAHAVLYAMTGTYGTSGKPTGDPLATSDDFDVSTLTGGRWDWQLVTFTFSGAQRYTMSANTYYCIVYENPSSGTINATDFVHVILDESSPTHGGNTVKFRNSAWDSAIYDTIFYVYGTPPAPAPPSQEWWDGSWVHRVPVNITGSTVGALTDYPVLFDLLVGSGVSSGNDIYTDGGAQSDYADIRFITADQTTLLDYWLTDNSTWVYPDATVWVDIPSIPANPDNVTIWVYWGNPAAPSLSDGSAVFPFFDDFSTDPHVNPDWTVTEGKDDYINHFDWYVLVRGASGVNAWAYIKGTKDLVLSGGSTTYGWSMEWENNIVTNTISDTFPFYGAGLADDLVHDYLEMDDLYSGVSWYWRLWDPFSGRLHYYDEWNDAGVAVQSDHFAYPWTYTLFADYPPTTGWTQYIMTLFSNSSQVYRSGVLAREFEELSTNYLTKGLDPSFSAHGKAGDGNSLEGFVNWVFLRPLADPEPTLAALGESEESEYPTNVGVIVTNIDSCDSHNWIFEGRKQYEFITYYRFAGGGENITAAGVGFYDGAGRFYNIILNTVTGKATATSPLDGMSAIYTDFKTSGEYLNVTFLISLNPTIADILNTPIYMISYYYDETASWEIAPLGENGWEFASYLHRIKITVNSSKIDEDLTDFPVLVHLNSTFDWAATQNDGDDIRFVNETNYALSAELELWDDENDAYMWVKLPFVSSSTDTYFWMYYGNPTAASAWDAVNVWDDNFVMVHHMVDENTSAILDSTQYDSDGIKKGANEPIETADGQIGPAQVFDGDDDYIDEGTDPIFDFVNAITIEAWLRPEEVVDWERIVVKAFAGTSTADSCYEFSIRIDNEWRWAVGGVFDDSPAAPAPVEDQWDYFVGTYDRVNAKMYIAGAVISSTEHNGTIRVNVDTSLTIGAVGWGEGYLFPYNGTMDEVRISNISRSAPWVKASYYSGDDDLLTFGEEEESPGYINELSIYNLGGFVSLDSTGVAGRHAGGDVFELYAGKGGIARANLTYKNLQHVGFLVEIQFPTDEDPGGGSFGYIRYGIDFCIDGVMYQGLVLQIEPWDLGVGVNDAWMEYYVSWRYNGAFIGDEIVKMIALWEAGTAETAEKQVARLWVDLWFNKMNASTTMGGRVNSYWYGMRKDVTWWNPFTWWSTWKPLMTNYTQSMFFTDLTVGGVTRSCTEITIMNAWCEIYRLNAGNVYNFSVINYDVFNIQVEEGSMRGIDTPIFTDTKVMALANQGFFAALIAAFNNGMKRIGESVWMTVMTSWTWFAGLIGAVTAYFGFPGLVSTITGVVDSAWGFLVTLVAEGYMFSVITNIFTVVTSTFGHILYWFTSVLTTFTNLFTIVWSLIDGTYEGVGVLQDLWATFGWATWADAVPIFIILNWFLSLDNRARKAGGGWIGFFIGDIMMIGGLLALFLNLSMIVINLTLGLIEKLINMIPVI